MYHIVGWMNTGDGGWLLVVADEDGAQLTFNSLQEAERVLEQKLK